MANNTVTFRPVAFLFSDDQNGKGQGRLI